MPVKRMIYSLTGVTVILCIVAFTIITIDILIEEEHTAMANSPAKIRSSTEMPSIDRKAPKQIETATFALG